MKQFAQAKQVYQELLLLLKDATLEEKQRAFMQASTLHNLGVVAQEQRAWEEAKSYYEQALQIYVEYGAAEGSGYLLLRLAQLWQTTQEKDPLETTASILSITPDEVVQRFEELLQASEERDEGDEGHDSPHL